MEEEKKEEVSSDFADETAPLEEQKSDLVVEEEPKEEKIEEVTWEREGEANVLAKEENSDERLATIEKYRAAFYSKYKKHNIIRWIASISTLALIAIGYIIPNTVPPMKGSTYGIYITLGVLALALIGLMVYNFVSKRSINKVMNQYFIDYYKEADSFVYEEDAKEEVGDANAKVDPALFKAADAFDNVYKIGSRDTVSIKINGKPATISDCAAQIQEGKKLKTVFVGKMFALENEYKGEQILIYIKGFANGLPPTSLLGKEKIIDDERMVAYGEPREFAKIFSDKTIAKILEEFNTNNILVDVTISIVEGKTFYFLGYDDAAMVLPLDKPLDCTPLSEIKRNYASIKKIDKLIKF